MARKKAYKPTDKDKRIWELFQHPSPQFNTDRICAMYMIHKSKVEQIVKQYDEFISASSKSIPNSDNGTPSD